MPTGCVASTNAQRMYESSIADKKVNLRPFPAPVAEPHPALALPSVRLHLDKQRLGWSYVLKEDGDIQTELRHNNGSTPVQSSLNRCFRHQLLLPHPYLVLTKPLRLDIQCQRAASVKIGWKYLDN